jgi:hypothetical protein
MHWVQWAHSQGHNRRAARPLRYLCTCTNATIIPTYWANGSGNAAIKQNPHPVDCVAAIRGEFVQRKQLHVSCLNTPPRADRKKKKKDSEQSQNELVSTTVARIKTAQVRLKIQRGA